MSRRTVLRERTRERIVEATASLHGERGVFGTSYQDIAREADVSVATVYKHFPSLNELLPACGALVMERARPPRPEQAAEVVGDATDLRERLRRVATELFAYYERGGPHLEVDARERQLPGMREWEKRERALVARFVGEALRPGEARPHTVRLVSALCDLPSFRALRTRGVSAAGAAEAVAIAGSCLLAQAQSKTHKQRKESR
ncbi:MAG: TetR/AcrR family transcriptional regulator [Actinomycetota bacterium]|nr:TetR/AcrR family transcriptional regulator [Actinomycetota bacterium]